MFDLLFLILISVFVPVIVFAGLKVYRVTDFRKITIGVSIAILAMEIIRFLCNAALYPEAETPKADIKFGYITVLVILILFATFRGGRSGKVFRDVAALTAFVPILSLPSCAHPAISTNWTSMPLARRSICWNAASRSLRGCCT